MVHYPRPFGLSGHLLSHSNSFGFEMEKDTAGCRAYHLNYIVGGLFANRNYIVGDIIINPSFYQPFISGFELSFQSSELIISKMLYSFFSSFSQDSMVAVACSSS